MSKKCNRSKQRRAERRNRSAAKRRAKRSRRTGVAETVHMIAKPTTISVETHIAYVEAHQLLPPDYPRDVADMQSELAMAMATLEEPRAGDAAILRAIMILAHTPDPRAREALQKYARLGTPYRDMAKLGADECATWLEDLVAPSPGPTFTVTALN